MLWYRVVFQILGFVRDYNKLNEQLKLAMRVKLRFLYCEIYTYILYIIHTLRN